MKTPSQETRTGVNVITTVADLKQWRMAVRNAQASSNSARKGQATVGFVPTMGALHEGHMTLIRKARQECEKVIVSIFVNPIQFAPNEDLSKYPRTFEQDLALCSEAGVDVIYHPSVEEMYPRGQDELTKIIPPESIINRLCGLFRPGHFVGVATVVGKLLNMVEPDISYFGEKDFQQLAVVKRMVQDLDMPVKIVGVPTVRDRDGLALSSRNVYLSKELRELAPILNKILCEILEQSLSGKTRLVDALEKGRRELAALPAVTVQYLEACDADSLEALTEARAPMVVLVAAKFGDVRLIDNVIAWK